MRKFFKITFFVSVSILSLVFLFAVISAISAMVVPSPSVGIIGGADGPTAILVTNTIVLHSPVVWVLVGAVVLFVVSLIGWITTRRNKKI